MPNLDADLVNADWIKRSWPFPLDTEWTLEALLEVSRLPVWERAPQELKDLLAEAIAGTQS